MFAVPPGQRREEASKMRTPRPERLLRSLLLDPRLKAFEKFLLLVLPTLPQEPDGSYRVSARYLALTCRSTERTATKGLRTLETAGYVELVSEGSSSKGGFKVFFRNTGLLAIMLAMMAGGNAALHKHSPSDTNAQKPIALHIIRQKRKRKVTTSTADKLHLEYLQMKHSAEHPLGQFAPTARSSPAA